MPAVGVGAIENRFLASLRSAYIETMFFKNVKWIAAIRGFKKVVLPSFTHLAWDLSVHGESFAEVIK